MNAGDLVGVNSSSWSAISMLPTEGIVAKVTSRLCRKDLCLTIVGRSSSCRITRAFLELKRVRTIAWPAYSPDLNPIEHLWWHLKKRMNKFYSQYSNHSDAQEEWDGFSEALQECWAVIPGKPIRVLILSMPRRTAACRAARGWQTKY
jgi:hypothetical protein